MYGGSGCQGNQKITSSLTISLQVNSSSLCSGNGDLQCSSCQCQPGQWVVCGMEYCYIIVTSSLQLWWRLWLQKWWSCTATERSLCLQVSVQQLHFNTSTHNIPTPSILSSCTVYSNANNFKLYFGGSGYKAQHWLTYDIAPLIPAWQHFVAANKKMPSLPLPALCFCSCIVLKAWRRNSAKGLSWVYVKIALSERMSYERVY